MPNNLNTNNSMNTAISVDSITSDKDKTKVEKKNGKWVAEGIDGQLTTILKKQFSSSQTKALIEAILFARK